jgi:hypothetical protein
MERERYMDTFFFSCVKALLLAIGVTLLACATGLMAEGQSTTAGSDDSSIQPVQGAPQPGAPASSTQPLQSQSPQPAKSDVLPNAPEPQRDGVDGASTQAQPHPNPITKRILWILPNFRTVPGDEKLPAQSTKEKFMVASRDSFDYSAMIVVGFSAGFHDFRDSYPEFGHGMSGYGQYYWHSGLDSVQENYLTEFVFPTLFHQDTRYYLQGKGGFWKRGIYAVSRAIITRSDAGNNVFNSSEVLGTGVAAGLSDLYYPSRVRTVGHTMQSWGINIAMDAIGFGAKEFGQDVERKWFHKPQ